MKRKFVYVVSVVNEGEIAIFHRDEKDVDFLIGECRAYKCRSETNRMLYRAMMNSGFVRADSMVKHTIIDSYTRGKGTK